jgi:protein-S-isoprenylcysteine O-methyltransferase Ste14
MGSLELKIPPPVVAAITGLAMWGAAHWLPGLRLLPLPHRLLPALVAVLGAAATIAGMATFRRVGTTVNPLQPAKATALVTGGVYRLTRNPMYLGLLLVLSAWALALASVPAWIGPVAFIAWITRFQVRPEERALATLFGADYAAYRARVRRWL